MKLQKVISLSMLVMLTGRAFGMTIPKSMENPRSVQESATPQSGPVVASGLTVTRRALVDPECRVRAHEVLELAHFGAQKSNPAIENLHDDYILAILADQSSMGSVHPALIHQ